jgi:hypothetical protein
MSERKPPETVAEVDEYAATIQRVRDAFTEQGLIAAQRTPTDEADEVEREKLLSMLAEGLEHISPAKLDPVFASLRAYAQRKEAEKAELDHRLRTWQRPTADDEDDSGG